MVKIKSNLKVVISNHKDLLSIAEQFNINFELIDLNSKNQYFIKQFLGW